MRCDVTRLMARRLVLDLLFGAGILAACSALTGAEEFVVVGQPGATAGALTVWLDPLDGTPVGLLARSGAADWLTPEDRVMTLHVVRDDMRSGGLPVLRVTDVLPEYWAEPAVWQHFRVGPASFSGRGRDLRIKDWAGRPFTNRRGYALDGGLAPRRTAASVSPAGPGILALASGETALSLTWSGVAGRVYALEHAADLSGPFVPRRTLIASDDGPVTILLAAEDAAGFYRVAELPQ